MGSLEARTSKPRLTHLRHICKAITWRIIGTVDTVVVGWAITGDPAVALSIGGFSTLTKLFLYYGHERAWSRVNFGIKREKNKES